MPFAPPSPDTLVDEGTNFVPPSPAEAVPDDAGFVPPHPSTYVDEGPKLDTSKLPPSPPARGYDFLGGQSDPSGSAQDLIGIARGAVSLPGKALVALGDIPTRLANRGLPPDSQIPTLAERQESGQFNLPTLEESKYDSKSAQIGTALFNTASKTLSGFIQPESAFTLALIPGEGAVSKAAAIAFGSAQLSELPEQVQNAITVLNDPKSTLTQRIQAVAEPGVSTVLGGLMVKHGMAKDMPAPPPKVQGPAATGASLKPLEITRPPEPRETALEYAGGEMPRNDTEFSVAGAQPPKDVQAEIPPNQVLTQKEEVPGEVQPADDNVTPPVTEPVGMGGAVPSEFENNPQTATGIKNATVDQERVKRGLPAAIEPMRRSFGQVWDKAMALIDQNPGVQDKLINELRDNPRALTDEEDALLLHRQVDLQNEYGKATRDLAQAHDDGRGEDVEREKQRTQLLSNQLQDLYDIGKKSGTETGRGLNARKMMAMEDFSLAQMEMQKRADNGGRQLTDDERRQLNEAHQKISDLTAKQAELESGNAESQKQYETEIGRLQGELGKRPEIPKPILEMARKITDTLHTRADAARIRLREKLNRVGSNPDPTIVLDLAEIAAEYVGKGLEKAAFAADKFVEEFGPKIQPYLDAAWEKAKQIWEQTHVQVAGNQADKVKRVTKKEKPTPMQREAEIVENVKEAPNDRALLSKVARELAKNEIDSGNTERESILDAVHGTLQQAIPELDKRSVRDAIGRYGQYKLLSKDPTLVRLREISAENQSISKLQDIQSSKAPLKTGVERQAFTDEKRRLEKLVNEAKKKYGIVTTDPARQLRSALDSIKTRLVNAINDVQHEIATRTKIVRDKTPTPTTPEIEGLRKQLADLREQKQAIFGKPEMTDEQRVRLAMSAVEKSITDLEQRIKTNDIGPRSRASKTPNTPELEAARAKRDALRAQLDELRDLDPNNIAEKQSAALDSEKKTLEKVIAEKERQLREGDLTPEGKAQNRPGNPLLEPLLQQRDALSAKISEARKKPEGVKEAERQQKQLDALNKAIAERVDKLAKGDLSSNAKAIKVNRPFPRDLELAAQRLAEVNTQIAEARKAARPRKTPEELALQRLKTATKNRDADYRDRLARNDFAPKTRTPVVPDEPLLRARAATERAKQEWQKARLKDQMKNLPRWEKIANWSTKFRRFTALSSPTVIPKLLAAGSWRALMTPVEDMAGGILSKIPGVSGISERAPTEGAGGQLKATMRGYGAALTKGMRDAVKVLTTGQSDLDAAYGKPFESYTGENQMASTILEIPGRLHGTEKAPIKRLGFEKAAQRLGEFYAKQGLDVSDPNVQKRIAVEAYKYGNRQIFLQDNRAASIFNTLLARAEARDETGKTPVSGKIAATMLRFMFPVVKVPLNLFHETYNYTPPSLLTGLGRTINALRKGMDELTPNQADLIMRELKKGSIGTVAMILGYIGYKNLGATYQEGRKPEKGEIKPGAARIFGHNIPANLLHYPALNAMQLGAEMHRTAEEKLRKGDSDVQGLGAGTLAAAWGLGEEVPFVEGPRRLFSGLSNRYTRQQTIGNEIKSIAVPGTVQWLAQVLDERREEPPKNAFDRVMGAPARLAPKTIGQAIKTGIPGLRQSVPEAKK